MGKYVIDGGLLTDLAESIRLRQDGSAAALTPAQMAQAVRALPCGGLPAKHYAMALDVAAKIKAVKDTGHDVVVIGCVSDCHVSAEDGYKTLSRQSMRHGAWALGLVGQLVGADLCADLGDSAWENNDNGDSFERWHENQAYAARVLAGGCGNVPLVRIPGNHDQSATVGNAYGYVGSGNRFDGVGATPERGYGYIDLADKKVRVIALNTSDYQGVTGGYDLSYEQKKWFMESLDLSGKADAAQWGIVILSHFPLDFSGASSYNTASEVQAILAAYVGGTAVTVTVESSYASANGETVADFSYDYTGKNSAKILLNAHGHLHNGAYGKMEGCEVPRACAYNSCFYLEKSDTYGEIYDVDTAYRKTNGTAADTAVTFYVIDRTEQMIHAFAYGAGADRELYCGEEKQYTVSYNLTNCASSNGSAIAVEGTAFSTVLTPEDDAELSAVTITMGGVDITETAYSGGTVTIGAVTGDIVITAVASVPQWSETVADVAVAIRSVWHMGASPAVPEMTGSNAYAAVGVTTANDFVYTDRESNAVYIMPVPEKAAKVTVANSDGSTCSWRFWGLQDNGDGTMNEVCASETYGAAAFTWTKGSISHILIAGYHTDDASWSWGYDDSQIGVTFSNY